MEWDPAVKTTIEYEDRFGRLTRRRINLHRTTESNGVTYITAYCIESRAPRSFRVDRVICFITEDGEVIEPQLFLKNPRKFDATTGFALNERVGRPQTWPAKDPWTAPKQDDPKWLTAGFWILTTAAVIFSLLMYSATQMASIGLVVFFVLWAPLLALRWFIGLFVNRSRR